MKRTQDLQLATMSRFSKYSLESNQSPTNAQSFTKGHRTDLWPGNSNPGPGSYEIIVGKSLERKSIDPEKPQSDNAVDDKKYLVERNKTVFPGPAEYNIDSPRAYHFSMGTKPFNLIVKKGSPGPGPGEYNTHRTKKTRVYSINRSARFNDIQELKPGPGYYEPNLNKTISFAYTTSPRFSNPKFMAPGPGAYGSESSDKKIAHKFRSCERITLRNEEDSPGPGTYNFQLKDALPKYSIGKSPRNQGSKVLLPGPGDYSPDSKHLERGMSFTHSRRRSLTLESSPGPASYNLASFSDKYVKKVNN